MTRSHAAQLLVCHQKIGAPDMPGKRWAWCDLPAHAWCFDCGFYACDIHALARHQTHDLQTVDAEHRDPSAVQP